MGLTLHGGAAGVWSGVVGATGSGLLGAALVAAKDVAVSGDWNVILCGVVLVSAVDAWSSGGGGCCLFVCC